MRCLQRGEEPVLWPTRSQKGLQLGLIGRPAAGRAADAWWATRLRLSQVLNNLVSNALKFTQQGEHPHCSQRR
jgi:signal transduction histidine kinase